MLDVDQVCKIMLEYIETSLETPHSLFAELPICPFVRVARLKHKLDLWVHPFDPSTEIDVSVQQKIEEFCLAQKDVLLVIHPNPIAMNFAALNRFVERLNDSIDALGLVAFGGHPDDPFEVNGVQTRHDPFINFTIQRQQKLTTARKSLLQTHYYQAWNGDALEAVGIEEMVRSAQTE
ncbi:hypothetical protein IQ250_23210 [Pseudanabaenaceae cyanobacterium LEGE 13415]|nr:hypothetical protein [Pseudanabaenaceae cyanobacterium LEGE 13415]